MLSDTNSVLMRFFRIIIIFFHQLTAFYFLLSIFVFCFFWHWHLDMPSTFSHLKYLERRRKWSRPSDGILTRLFRGRLCGPWIFQPLIPLDSPCFTDFLSKTVNLSRSCEFKLLRSSESPLGI